MEIERSHGRSTTLGERLARERFEKAHPIVREGFKGGHFKALTKRQEEVLTALYPLNDVVEENFTETGSIIMSYEQCGKSLGITRQAVEQSHNSGVRTLGRAISGLPPVQEDNKGQEYRSYRLEMSPEERQYILTHCDLPAMAISRAIGHSEEIIGRWFDELSIPRKSRGHPRKQA